MKPEDITEEYIKSEIAAAVKIVNDDKRRAQYKSLHEEFGQEESPKDPKEGDPPPPKDPVPPVANIHPWWGKVE